MGEQAQRLLLYALEVGGEELAALGLDLMHLMTFETSLNISNFKARITPHSRRLAPHALLRLTHPLLTLYHASRLSPHAPPRLTPRSSRLTLAATLLTQQVARNVSTRAVRLAPLNGLLDQKPKADLLS